MRDKKLKKLIEEAYIACEIVRDKKGLSLVEKMGPYVHLNNLLMLKYKRLENDKKHNKPNNNGKNW